MIRREKSGAVRRVETDMFHYTSSDEEWKRNVLYGLKAIYEAVRDQQRRRSWLSRFFLGSQ